MHAHKTYVVRKFWRSLQQRVSAHNEIFSFFPFRVSNPIEIDSKFIQRGFLLFVFNQPSKCIHVRDFYARVTFRFVRVAVHTFAYTPLAYLYLWRQMLHDNFASIALDYGFRIRECRFSDRFIIGTCTQSTECGKTATPLHGVWLAGGNVSTNTSLADSRKKEYRNLNRAGEPHVHRTNIERTQQRRVCEREGEENERLNP